MRAAPTPDDMSHNLGFTRRDGFKALPSDQDDRPAVPRKACAHEGAAREPHTTRSTLDARLRPPRHPREGGGPSRHMHHNAHALDVQGPQPQTITIQYTPTGESL